MPVPIGCLSSNTSLDFLAVAWPSVVSYEQFIFQKGMGSEHEDCYGTRKKLGVVV